MELSELKQLYASRRREFSWIDLSRQDLTGWNLSGIILRESNLEGAILTDINLTNARLPKAQMNGVNLRNANLSGAKFAGASLRYADFTGAILTGTDFRGADLSYACFASAHLEQTEFQSAKLEGVDWGEHEPAQISDMLSEHPIPETKPPLPAPRPFREKWRYRPQDLLTANQKFALSPWLWLGFVGLSYIYQGFYCAQFAKGVYFALALLVVGISPCLWLFGAYWLYPAGLVSLILFTTLDIFILAFGSIVMVFAVNGAKKYRAILDKQPPTLSPAVWRDGISLGLGAIVFITLFRSLLVQPATVGFVGAGALASIAGAIGRDLLGSLPTTALMRWVLVGWSAWLGLIVGMVLGLG